MRWADPAATTSQRSLPLPWLFLAVGLGYAAGSELAFRLADAAELEAVLFIPAGITLGALVRTPRRAWWVVLMAAALAELAQDLRSDLTVGQSLGFVAANTIEPLVGAALIGRVLPAPIDLARRRDVRWFVIGAVVIAPAVGATIGAATDRGLAGDDLVEVFWQWWLGDALGVLLVGSLILVWKSGPDRLSIGSWWGAGLVSGSSLLTMLVLWLTDLPLLFLVLAGVVVAGAQFGSRAVAVTAVAVAVTAAIEMAIGEGALITGLSDATALAVIKLQFGVFTIAGLVVASEAFERELATAGAARLEAEANAEHVLVERLQRLLLPPEQMAGEHFVAYGRYSAASTALGVGGDWYDVAELPDGRVFVSVGDVVGHGAGAAAVMSKLRVVMSVVAGEADEPGQLLERVDSFAAATPGASCATAWVGYFDPLGGRLSYASAGHPPGFLIGSDGGVVRLDGAVSPPIGVETDLRPTVTVEIESSATLVLYTDGLVERRGETIDEGLRRVESILSSVASSTGPEREAILDSLARGEHRDDTVLLTVTLDRTRTCANLAPAEGPGIPDPPGGRPS